MSKPRILLQLDTDPHPSVFDAVVAVDAGAEHVFRHAGVTADSARALVHGLMFTRGPEDLKHSAIFLGGNSVDRAEAVFAAVKESFFGPLRVSVMLDANGANTTAAAAVLAAAAHLDLTRTRALILGGTGPVGQRAARLLASQGARVRLGSREASRAAAAAAAVQARYPRAQLEAVATGGADPLRLALADVELVIAAGAAGIPLLTTDERQAAGELRVAIDLNAVPPAGIAGVEATDRARERDGVLSYGAIGVGGTKMKIHKAALRRLFETNDALLDAEEIFAIGQALG